MTTPYIIACNLITEDRIRLPSYRHIQVAAQHIGDAPEIALPYFTEILQFLRSDIEDAAQQLSEKIAAWNTFSLNQMLALINMAVNLSPDIFFQQEWLQDFIENPIFENLAILLPDSSYGKKLGKKRLDLIVTQILG